MDSTATKEQREAKSIEDFKEIYIAKKTKKPPQKAEEDKTEHIASQAVLELLQDKNLFYRITKDELGKKIEGELETRQTIFLCACGKYVENCQPASFNLLQNATAGAGKDFTLNATLSIFPKESYLKRTRISPRVINYWHSHDKEPDWSWDGKIVYLEDVSNELLNSEVVKVFCSSGSCATIVINNEAKDIEIVGKPVVLFSSATARLSEEMLRRTPILQCDESENQTKGIMLRQAIAAKEGKTLIFDEDITKALYFLKRVKVVIPFAEQLLSFIPPKHIILRTHFQRLLDYIKASAALYQFQRNLDSDGCIIAEPMDYEIARIAFNKTTSNQFFVPLSHNQRKLLEILADMAKADGQTTLGEIGFTANEIGERVHFWSEKNSSQLYEELNKLANNGLLICGKKRTEGAKKDSKTFRLAEIMKTALPSWEEIEASCQKIGINGSIGINGTIGTNGININSDNSDNSYNILTAKLADGGATP